MIEDEAVDWINYHHLHYFWVVARTGSIAAACAELQIAQPTVSGQLAKLERSLKVKLFRRAGRGLELTDDGRLVQRYAEEIFGLGREMLDALRGRPTGRPLRFTVGVSDVLPKLVVHRLLEPALGLSEAIHLVCPEGKFEDLLAELARHDLDLVLSDRPVGPQTRLRAFNHVLGECGVSVFGTADLARTYRSGFPACLDQAPMLLPTPNTSLRRSLDQWFDRLDLRPRIAGEFEDSALLKAFGQAGAGLFPAPSAIEREIRRQYDVEVVGRIEAVRERYFAISVERRLKHPAVVAISTAARTTLFPSRAAIE